MRYLFYAIALAALVIAGWNTTELMKRQPGTDPSVGTTQTSTSSDLNTRLAEIENSILELAASSGNPEAIPQQSSDGAARELDARLSEIENSILELAANSGNQGETTPPPSLENRIAKLENQAANAPSGFDASQLFEGMAELAGKVQALENNSQTPNETSTAQPFDPSELFAGLAQINDRLGKLEQSEPANTPNVPAQSLDLEDIKTRLSALEDRDQTTPSAFDGDALFEGVAELAARIGSLESRLASTPSPSGDNKLKPDVADNSETLKEIKNINERIARLENKPSVPAPDTQNSGQTKQILSGLVEVTRRLEVLENRQPTSDDDKVLAEIGDTLEVQANEIAALKANIRNSASDQPEKTVQLVRLLTERVATLEELLKKTDNQSDPDKLLSGMIELSKKVSALEARTSDLSLQSKLESTDQKIQELGTAVALLQEVKPADEIGQNSDFMNGLENLDTRLTKLENEPPQSPTLPSDLFENLQNLSTRLDKIENQSGGRAQDTDRQSAETLAQLTSRVQILEERSEDSANTETGAIEGSIRALSKRLEKIEAAPERATPLDLLENLTDLTGRIDQLENISPEDNIARQATETLTKQVENLANKLEKLSNSPSERKDSSPNEEILAGIAELSGRIAALESAAAKSGNEQIDGDALFEGMATLAHRINELENRLK